MSDKQWIPVSVAAVLIGVLTLPRLWINYGLDYDCNSVAQAAERLFRTGVYHPSRFPGSPLFEYLLALIVPWAGPVGSNLLVLISFLLGLWVFAKLAQGKSQGPVLTVLYATTPILLLNAVTTIDYIPGLTLLLCSYWFATQKKNLLASVFLGLAIGFRLTHVLFLLPLALYFILRKERSLKVLQYAVITVAVGASFFLPIIWQYGLKMLNTGGVYQIYSLPLYLARTGYELLNVFGLIGTLTLAVLLGLRTRRVVQFLKSWRGLNPETWVELTALALFVLLFLTHSDEGDYLIPVIPFLYLFLDRFLSRPQWILLGMAILSFAFFNIEVKGGESGQKELQVQPTAGVILKDFRDRQELEWLRAGIGRFPQASRAVILTGMGPDLIYNNTFLSKATYNEISPRLDPDGFRGINRITRIADSEVFLVSALSQDNCLELQKEGWEMYIFSEHAPALAFHAFNYDPYKLGIKKLEVLNDRAFYKQNHW